MNSIIKAVPQIGIEEVFDEKAVEELVKFRNEDVLLKHVRRDAWNLFNIIPSPNTKMEEWRRSSIKDIPFEEFTVGTIEPVKCPNPPLPPKDVTKNSIVIYSCDGVLLRTEGLEKIRESGVVITTWQQAVREHSDLAFEILQNPLVRWENGKFEALNGALMNTGLLIYVPRNVQIPRTIQNWMYFTEPGRAYFPKVTVIAEAGAELTYVENINAPMMYKPMFINGVTEIIAKENSRVNFYRIQNLEDNAYYIDNGRAKLWNDARLHHLQANMGAGWAKTKFETKLVGENSEAKLDGIYFASQNQHLDQKTMQYHEAPFTYSNLDYHGVVTDNAHTIYQGMIRAEEIAVKTDAYQKNKNLILSDNARADSIPGLEILTNDLSCSHGATVGKIDRKQLYYLMSRGLSENDAKQLIVSGFLGEVVNRIADEEMIQLVSDIINGKILKELKFKEIGSHGK